LTQKRGRRESGVGGSSEEKHIIHGDVQVRGESGAGHLGATVITSFPVDKKTRPHKAAGMVDVGMSLSVLLQLRAWIAVGKNQIANSDSTLQQKMPNLFSRWFSPF
jgi:hypothetical protein